MAKEPELTIVTKLTAKIVAINGRGVDPVERDTWGKRAFENPDGPEAAAIITELVEALDEASADLCNLQCRSPASSDPAKHTPGCTRYSAALTRAGAKQ